MKITNSRYPKVICYLDLDQDQDLSRSLEEKESHIGTCLEQYLLRNHNDLGVPKYIVSRHYHIY